MLDALRSIAISQFAISKRKRSPVDGIMDIEGLVLDYMPRWPVVRSHDWCGEYEQRKTSCTEEPSHRVDLTDLRKTIGRLYGIVKDMERDAKD